MNKLELNEVYFYQGTWDGRHRCIFLRAINRCEGFTLVVTCLNLLDAFKLPILENWTDYGPYQQKGYVESVWKIKEEEFIKKSILIPHDKLHPDRYATIVNSNGVTTMIYPKSMNKTSYKRELYINNILENGEEE